MAGSTQELSWQRLFDLPGARDCICIDRINAPFIFLSHHEGAWGWTCSLTWTSPRGRAVPWHFSSSAREDVLRAPRGPGADAPAAAAGAGDLHLWLLHREVAIAVGGSSSFCHTGFSCVEITARPAAERISELLTLKKNQLWSLNMCKSWHYWLFSCKLVLFLFFSQPRSFQFKLSSDCLLLAVICMLSFCHCY